MKTEMLSKLNDHYGQIKTLHSSLVQVKSQWISTGTLRETTKTVCRVWFDHISPILSQNHVDPDLTGKYTSYFEQLLKYSRKNSRKTSYCKIVDDLIKNYQDDLIHRIEISRFATVSHGLNISPYIEGLEEDEKAYLKEAVTCAEADCRRASVILGWCAMIDKIHKKILAEGFEKFNKASSEMQAKTYGRFKPFKKKIAINSLSELRLVFDTHLLWVLEYLGYIDNNEHERLRHCFLMRNNSAHPGEAPITGENVYSFYSDITRIVLKNPKFGLK